MTSLGIPSMCSGADPVLDLAYGTLERQKLDIYSPKDAENAPVLVFFHGGAWKHGDKTMHAFVGKAYAAEGVVTVIPNYRLFPEVRFPDFMKDAALAVKWTREHVKKHGGNPDHIILAGHSAGGHIASLLGTNQEFLRGESGEEPKWLRGVISLSGVLDSSLFRLGTAQPVFKGSKRADIMPIGFIDESDPPFLLVQGGLDLMVSPRQSRNFEKALKEANVDVVTSYHEFAEHGMTLMAFARKFPQIEIMDSSLTFIREQAPKP